MATLEQQIANLVATSNALTQRVQQLLDLGIDADAIAQMIQDELANPASPTSLAIANAVDAAVTNSTTLNQLVPDVINTAIGNGTLNIDLSGYLGKAGGAMTGRADLHSYTIKRVDIGAAGGAVPLNVSLGNYFQHTANGNVAYTFTNVPGGQVVSGFILELTNGGNFSISWPASVKWPGGVAPTLANAGTDLLSFITDDNGVTWRAARAIGDSR